MYTCDLLVREEAVGGVIGRTRVRASFQPAADGRPVGGTGRAGDFGQR